jgi:4a-hydroxytetrahydrobiopterin dehydratase
MLKKKDWSTQPRQAMGAVAVVSALAKLEGWQLAGDGADVAIEKTYHFANYDDTLAFVNAVAFIARVQDHHPLLTAGYKHCSVRFNTHDVGGLSATDFDCAAKVDALLA